MREGGGACEGRMDGQKDRHTSINNFVLKIREFHLHKLCRSL